MKIAITGHTKGIGNALLVHNMQLGHDVVGFSRFTGHDVSLPSMVDLIIADAEGSDVFINNAYHGFSQVNLLYGLHSRYANQKMLIINVSSNSSDGIKSKTWPYSVHKAALDKASEQLSYQNTRCKVSNLRMGYVDIPRMADITHPKISTKSACAAIDFMISQWIAGHCVKELTLLP